MFITKCKINLTYKFLAIKATKIIKKKHLYPLTFWKSNKKR